ncbi:MAG TPA: cache domain-containing protein, partial [Candidatus Binatia bacterium]|nr:cache domain-containing protein [Candidatus Binatia bacterium]
MERDLRERARILALAVDQELVSALHTLQALATSEHLDSEAFAEFHRLSVRVLTSQSEWKTIILYDLSGREIINSLRAFRVGSPHRTAERERFDQVVRTWKPVLGANFMIVPGKEPVVTVLVPVLRDGKLKYVLATAIETTIFDHLLTQRKIPFDWVATVVDQNKNVVATTRSPEFVGKPAGSLMRKASPNQPEGWIKGHNEDGVRSYMAFSRAPVSEWSVALAIPASTIDVPLLRSLWTLAGVGISFLVVGILFAVIFGRRIAESINSLSLATKALGRGDPVVISRPSSVTEVDMLGRDLEQAS